MKRSFIALLAILAFLAVSPRAVLFSQEEITNYSYGEVVSISGDTIVIEEISFDEETGEETTETIEFDIAPNIELEGLETLTDIGPGAELEIEYVEQEGKKVAIYVYYVLTE
jgi:hypothetical protein